MKKFLSLFIFLTVAMSSAQANNIYHKRTGTDTVPFYTGEVRTKKPPVITRGRNLLLPAAVTAAGVAVGASLAVKPNRTVEIEDIGSLQFTFDWQMEGVFNSGEIRFVLLGPDGSQLESFILNASTGSPDTANSSVFTNVEEGTNYTVRVTLVDTNLMNNTEALTMRAFLNGNLIETKFATPPVAGNEFVFTMPNT